MSTTTEYQTITEVAKRLNLSYNAVRAEINRANLPAIKIGDTYRIKSDDVDAWLTRCQVQPGALPDSAVRALEAEHILPPPQKRPARQPAKVPGVARAGASKRPRSS